MGIDLASLDEQIERLRGGDTLTENEVRALCDRVSWLLSVLSVGQAVLTVMTGWDSRRKIGY